jgi:hypothetical protein
MAAITLDRVLTYAEALPSEEQEMLEELLRNRRVEAWREQTSAEARTAAKAFRSGKLKAEPVESVINRLRASLGKNRG